MYTFGFAFAVVALALIGRLDMRINALAELSAKRPERVGSRRETRAIQILTRAGLWIFLALVALGGYRLLSERVFN